MTPCEEFNERLKLLSMQINIMKKHFDGLHAIQKEHIDTYFDMLNRHYDALIELLKEHPKLKEE